MHAGLGFLVPGASLTAMQADLAAALQLSIYAAPAREMPVSVQVCCQRQHHSLALYAYVHTYATQICARVGALPGGDI